MELDLAPLMVDIFQQAQNDYGPREKPPNIIRHYGEPLGLRVLGQGFPTEMQHDKPEEYGHEVKVSDRQLYTALKRSTTAGTLTWSNGLEQPS